MKKRYSNEHIAKIQAELKQATAAGYLDNLHTKVNWILDFLQSDRTALLKLLGECYPIVSADSENRKQLGNGDHEELLTRIEQIQKEGENNGNI